MLEPDIRELAEGPNYAVVTTLFPDGRPQSSVVWVDIDEEHVLINSVRTHQKVRNVANDPRVTVVITDVSRPHRYVEVRGRVVEVRGGPEARAHLDDVARRYTGKPYEREVTNERVILVIEPDRQRGGGRG